MIAQRDLGRLDALGVCLRPEKLPRANPRHLNQLCVGHVSRFISIERVGYGCALVIGKRQRIAIRQVGIRQTPADPAQRARLRVKNELHRVVVSVLKSQACRTVIRHVARLPDFPGHLVQRQTAGLVQVHVIGQGGETPACEKRQQH